MSTRSLGTLTLDLVAKIGGFEQGMDQAGRVSEKRTKEIAANFGKLGTAIGVGLSAAAIGATALIRESLNSADDLSKLSRSIGLTTEALSQLKFAADLSGVEDIGTALNKFNKNIGEASIGTKEQADAFKALGINVKDAAGNIRPTEDLLNDVADAFSRYADGASKSTVAQKLFGRAGADLITFLDGGKKGIGELRDEADKLGLTLTQDAAEAAEQFNDNIDRVKAASEGLTNQITIGLAPTLMDLSNQFVAYSTTASNVEGATHGIDVALKGLIISGIAVKSAFVAVGKTIGGVLAASQRAFQDVGPSDALIPGKFIYHLAKNASATLDVLQDAYGDAKSKVSDDIEAIVDVIEAGNQKIADAQVNNDAQKPQLKLIDSAAAASGKAAKAAKEQADAVDKTIAALQEQAATLGFNERALALYKATSEGATSSQLAQINTLYDSVDAFKATQDAQQKAADAEKSLQDQHLETLQSLQQFLDQDSFGTAASDIRKAFEGIGDPIAGLIDGMSEFVNVSKQAAEQVAKIKSDKLMSDADKAAAIAAVQERTLRATVGTYGDLADAASGFFNEGSKGYKTLQAVSMAFHAAELAATIAELVPKGISAVLSQGSGDPYSAFGRMAAMAAIVAGLGVAIGGVGGGGSFSKPNSGIGAGKGTVLGDSDATSKSIGNSLDALVDLQDKGLFVAQSQLDALRAIQVGITGVGNLLYRSNVSAGGPTPFNTQTSSARNFGGVENFVGHANDLLANVSLPDKIVKSIFGVDFRDFDVGNLLLKGILGSTKTKQVDSGIFIQAGQTLGDVLGGELDALYYATIKITKKKLFGLSKSSKTRDEFASVDDELTGQFVQIISGLGNSAIEAAAMLGVDADKATDLLNEMVLNIGKISLDDLKPDEVQDKLNAVFSALGDDIVAALQDGIHEGDVDIAGLLPGLDQFQKTGEGLYETLLRVASETVAVQHVIDAMGMSFGVLTGLDLADAAENIIDLSGGIDQFASNVNDFLDGFLTDTQKLQMQGSQLREQLDGIGYALPTTRDGFAALVQSLDLTDAGGRAAYAALLALSGQAAQFYDTVESNYSDFVDSFMSDSDRLAIEGGKLSDELAALGYALPDSRDGFAQIAEGIDRTTDAGESLYEALLSLSGQAGTYYDDLESAAEDQLSALNDAISDNQSTFDSAVQDYKSALGEITQTLQDQISGISDARTGIGAGVLSVQRSSGFDELGYQKGIIANLYGQIGSGSVEDQTDTVKALTQAIQDRYSAELAQINDAKSAADSLYATQQQTIESLRDALKGLKDYADSLKLSDLSPLTNAARLTESRNQYGSALLQAQRGTDPAAIAALQSAAGAYLTEARSYNASSEDYTKIFGAVEAELYRVSGRSVSAGLPPNTGVYDQQIANLQSKAVDELLGLQDVLDDVSVQAHEEAMQQTDALTVTFQQSAADIIESISKASEEAAAKLSEQMAAARAQAQKISADNIAALQAVVIATIQGSAATVAAISAIPPPPSTAKVA